jgi:hypothetical protein
VEYTLQNGTAMIVGSNESPHYLTATEPPYGIGLNVPITIRVRAANPSGVGDWSWPFYGSRVSVITIVQDSTSQISQNGNATFSVVAAVTDGATLSYQWEKHVEDGSPSLNFVPIPGATSASLLLTGLTYEENNGDAYRCIVSATGGADNAYSMLSTLTVPWIQVLEWPTNQSAINGSATFSVYAAVSLSGTVSFQWQKQEGGVGAFVNISGATTENAPVGLRSRLVLTGLTEADDNGDVYRVIVSSDNGATPVTSDPVTLTVNAAPVITITSQPTNQTASSGAATFSVAATVTQGATLSYQWQKQEGGAGNFANVSGATSASLALSSLTNAADDGDVYRVVVSATGGANSVTSNAATLTVEAPATPVITITQQPTNQLAVGGAATFSVTATVTEGATLSYQWQEQTFSGAFSDIAGATSASLALTGLTASADGLVVRVIVSATGGATPVTSDSATLTVEEEETPPILLARFDGDTFVDDGPNNYWLGSQGNYDSGSVGDISGFYAIPSTVGGGPFGGNCLQVGPEPYGSGPFLTATIRTNGYYYDPVYQPVQPPLVGQWHFRNQVNATSFTVEMFYKPGVGSLTTYDQYLGSTERYFTVGGFTVAAVASDENNPYGAVPVNYTAVYADVYANFGSERAYTTTMLTENAWNHLALVVDYANDQCRLYINGALACTGVASPSGPIDEFGLGPWYTAASSFVSNFRVSAGAIYSGSTITVPTAAFAYTRPTNPTTELLLRAAHGLEDWGCRRHFLKLSYTYLFPGDIPKISGAEKKFGEASYQFGLTGNGPPYMGMTLWPEWGGGYASYFSDMAAVFNGGPFTVEMWLRPTASPAYSTGTAYGEWTPDDGETYFAVQLNANSIQGGSGGSLLVVYDNTISTPQYAYDENGVVYQHVAIPGGGVTMELFTNGVSARLTVPSLSRNAWHHLAVVCDPANGVLRLKIDGSEAGTLAIPSGTWAAYEYGAIEFGRAQALADQWSGSGIGGKFVGYMDDIRISSTALYGTGSYSVPAAALT